MTDDWLSGESGQVHGIRATTRALLGDGVCDAIAWSRLQPLALRRAAARSPSRRVLVLAVQRTDAPNLWPAARDELLASHHAVQVHVREVGSAGKFENLNALLAEHPAAGHDWLLVVDDDVALPRGFLDVFLFLAERFGFALAQPAHRRRSHAAWAVTRRRPGVVARRSALVEIGPVTALAAPVFDALLPFPELRYGWGLDAHWSALAQRHGWPMGIVDAAPIRHGLRRIASSYSHADAVAESRAFLRARPYAPASDLRRTLETHGSWR